MLVNVQTQRKLSRDRATARSIFVNTPRMKPRQIIKPVYFFGRHLSGGFKLGGTYLIEALRQAGIDARIGKKSDTYRIRDSVFVYVKENIPGDLASIKNRGNKIIIDMRDNFALPSGAFNPNFVGRDVADYLLFPNQALLDKFLSIEPTTSTCRVLYGFADPALTFFFQKSGYRNLNTLKCCYFGYDFNLDPRALDGKLSIDVIPLTEQTFDIFLPRLRDYNLHIDFRPQEKENLYKPLTKILIAAECRANIIITKTSRVMELLPEDYPFLLVDNNNNIDAVMEQAYAIFGTPAWHKASAAMDAIREKYTLMSYRNEYINILEHCSDN